MDRETTIDASKLEALQVMDRLTTECSLIFVCLGSIPHYRQEQRWSLESFRATRTVRVGLVFHLTLHPLVLTRSLKLKQAKTTTCSSVWFLNFPPETFLFFNPET